MTTFTNIYQILGFTASQNAFSCNIQVSLCLLSFLMLILSEKLLILTCEKHNIVHHHLTTFYKLIKHLFS